MRDLTVRSYNHMVVLMQMVLDHDRIFGALGDANRRDIVRLAIEGETSQQAPHRAAKGRPHQPRGASRGAAPVRPIRGAVARARRTYEPTHERIARGGRPMTVTDIRKDSRSRSVTLEAEVDA